MNTKYYTEQEMATMMMNIIVDAIKTAKICDVTDPNAIQHGVICSMAGKALDCGVEIPGEVKSLVGSDSMKTMMEIHENFAH